MNKYVYILSIVVVLTVGMLWVDGIYFDKPVEEMAAVYANDQSQFIDIDGMNVHYRDEGQGPTLILLHGVNSSLHTWEGWVEYLKKDFRIISLDLPGYGLTGPHPQHRYTMEDTAQFLDKFTNAIGVSHFHLAGNSRGGNVAWTFAVLYPEKVDRLVLLDSAGLPRDEPRTLLLAIQTMPVVKDVIQNITPKWVTSLGVSQVYGNDDLISEEKRILYHDLVLREGNREAGSKALEQLYPEERLITKLKTLPHKTLIMWGDQDTWIPLKYGDRLEALIPDSTKIVYPGVGHIPMEEIPEQSAKDARAFFLQALKESF